MSDVASELCRRVPKHCPIRSTSVLAFSCFIMRLAEFAYPLSFIIEDRDF